MTSTVDEIWNELPDKYTNNVNLIGNKLDTLDDIDIPKNTIRLQVDTNNLTEMHSLPPRLLALSATNNKLTYLPSLPKNIKILDVGSNKLTTLPELPDKLRFLRCDHNPITFIPSLPSTLLVFSCAYTNISQLPSIPWELKNLSFSNCPNLSQKYIIKLSVTGRLKRIDSIKICQYNEKAQEYGLPTVTELPNKEEYNRVMFHDTGKQVSRMVEVGNVLLSAGLPPLVVAEIVDKENPSVSAFYVEQINGLMESLNQQRNSIIRSRHSKQNNDDDDEIPSSRYKIKTKAHTNIKSIRGFLPETTF